MLSKKYKMLWKAIVVMQAFAVCVVTDEAAACDGASSHIVRNEGSYDNNVWPVGYTGGFYNALFCDITPTPGQYNNNIAWWIGGVVAQVSFSPFASVNGENCRNDDSYAGYSATCRIRPSDGCVSTTLTITSPLTQAHDQSELKIMVNGKICGETILTVKACKATPPLSVLITAPAIGNGMYMSEGQAQCDNGGLLYNAAGKRIPVVTTTCSKNAEWTHLAEVYCGQVPKMKIGDNSDIYVNDGEELSLNCEYFPQIPPAIRQTFFVNQRPYPVKVGEHFSHSFSPEDNGKQISCKIETDYTETMNRSDLSSSRIINVYYSPRRHRNDSIICNWLLGTTNYCDVIFHSNPTVTSVKLQKGNVTITEEKRLIEFTFMDQVFQFHKQNVTVLDEGNYTLWLEWDRTPDNLMAIDFEINVFDDDTNPSVILQTMFTASPTDATGLIVVSIIAIIVLTLLLLMFKSFRDRNLKESAEHMSRSLTYRRHVDNDVSASKTTTTSQSSEKKVTRDEKEEKINPFYHSFDDNDIHDGTYTAIETKRLSSDASNDETVNPLYGATAQSLDKRASDASNDEIVNPLYGATAQSLDKREDGQSMKEEIENPLYGSSMEHNISTKDMNGNNRVSLSQ